MAAGSLAMGIGLAGCSVAGPSGHVTPQVSGRVLAGDTHEPLARVKVVAGQSPRAETPAHGAELLQRGRPVLTDDGGNFVFPSRSYMTLFRRAGWWSLRLSFQAPHYAPFQTNFTTAHISEPVSDATPLVQAGDIILQPLSK